MIHDLKKAKFEPRCPATCGRGFLALDHPPARMVLKLRPPCTIIWGSAPALHFATHGALTGQVQGSAEPRLILTPPAKDASDPEALERDDGFLTASEIATLKLDADWVILSACNTAGAQSENAEALSGIARAFFYAGARALLVSHWEVGSEAAVKLTTRAFAELKGNPKIGRAEAFRLSMKELVETGSLANAHPTMWAPFVV